MCIVFLNISFNLIRNSDMCGYALSHSRWVAQMRNPTLLSQVSCADAECNSPLAGELRQHCEHRRKKKERALVVASPRFMRGLCLRRPGSHVACACACVVPVHTWLVLASPRFTRGVCLCLCLGLRSTCKQPQELSMIGGGGGGGSPIYKPYRYVPPQRVSFSSISGLKLKLIGRAIVESFRHIWQSPPPLLTRPFSTKWTCEEGWGNDSTIALPTRDNTSLGSNKLYPHISVHNCCTGSLWNNLRIWSFSSRFLNLLGRGHSMWLAIMSNRHLLFSGERPSIWSASGQFLNLTLATCIPVIIATYVNVMNTVGVILPLAAHPRCWTWPNHNSTKRPRTAPQATL